MTCFWNGILRSLDTTDFQFAMKRNDRPQPKEFIHWLKYANSYPVDVYWNNQKLSQKELEEHKIAIETYDINNIYNGYLCSACDSFLLLIAQLFHVNIQHSYRNVIITYKYIKTSRKTLKFVSNSIHFQCVRR